MSYALLSVLELEYFIVMCGFIRIFDFALVFQLRVQQ